MASDRAPPTTALPESLTVYNAPEVKSLLLAALEGAADRLRVDASATAELDTAGVQVLLALAKEAARRGVALQILQPTQRLHQALKLIGVSNRFEILAAEGARP